MTRIRVSLAAKLAACLVASTAAFFALFGYVNVRDQRLHSEELILQAADRVTDIIQRSTHYDMLRNDREALYHVIDDIGREPGIRRVRIFNKEGRIRFSTDAGEINRAVDKSAEQCYACHAQAAPLAKLNRPDRARIFRGADGQRILGVIRPIENLPACSNGGCHAHPAEQRVLGVIDANLTLASVDAQVAAHQWHLVLFTIAAVVLVSLLSVVFIWAVVYRPVHSLITGTHRVADGDLRYRLPVHSDDELGDLAKSFNKMTGELAAVYGEIEERVRRKTEELEQIHKTLLRTEKMASIGKLAATVAHEVNNPLFGILTYARLTMKAIEKLAFPGKEDSIEHLQIIERESKRCGDLMRNLLTFARQTPSNREPGNVNVLIERAAALVRHKLEMQQITYHQELAGDLPPVLCDAGQIQQVVLVLMVNAAEAMPKGGELRVSTHAAGPDKLEIRVRDSGGGIPPEVMPQIFDPFFTTKEDQQRTGLGLAVAKSIVEQHGGEISVQSSRGEGAEFTVTLPVARVEETGEILAGRSAARVIPAGGV